MLPNLMRSKGNPFERTRNTEPASQMTLQWHDERCPKCHGAGDTYFQTGGVDVVGGKRITCSVCDGAGLTLVPAPRR